MLASIHESTRARPAVCLRHEAIRIPCGPAGSRCGGLNGGRQAVRAGPYTCLHPVLQAERGPVVLPSFGQEGSPNTSGPSTG